MQDVYLYFTTLCSDSTAVDTLKKFDFIKEWPTLTNDEKEKKVIKLINKIYLFLKKNGNMN